MMNEDQQTEPQVISENEVNPSNSVLEDKMDDTELFFGDELNESEEFSGDELDEITESREDEGGASKEWSQETSGDVKEASLGTSFKPSVKKKGVMVLIGLILGNMLAGGVFFIWFQHSATKSRNTPIIIHQTVPPAKVVVFDLFVIPSNNTDLFSYVSIGMTFRIRKDLVYREVVEKQFLLRGIIYDVLAREINKTSNIPQLGTLKALIIRSVNKVLSAGNIHGVYIDQYLAV